MRKLLLKGIGYCIALTAALFLLPATGMTKMGNPDNYWQATLAKSVLDQIAKYYQVNIAYENKLLEKKYTTYKFDPYRTSLSKALEDLLQPLDLKVSPLDDKNYTIIALQPPVNKKVVDFTASAPTSLPEN